MIGKKYYPAITKPSQIANQDASKCPLDLVRLQALLKSKQEKSVNGSTPATIVVMSAKKAWLINILSALRMMLLIIFSSIFPLFIKQLIPKSTIVIVFLILHWLSLSQKLHLTVQCYVEHTNDKI